MKCLSVQQPWSWLLCKGIKDVENRSWETEFRGPFFIHAGKKIDTGSALHFLGSGIEFPERFETGAIVGAAVLTNCTRVQRSDWHQHGQFGFYVESPILFKKPVPWRGKLGFFDVPDTAVPEVAEWLKQVRAA
jgi:hypothetical protein